MITRPRQHHALHGTHEVPDHRRRAGHPRAVGVRRRIGLAVGRRFRAGQQAVAQRRQDQHRIGLVDRQFLRLQLRVAGKVGRRHGHRVRAIGQARQIARNMIPRHGQRDVLHLAESVLDHRRRTGHIQQRIRRRVGLAVRGRLCTGQQVVAQRRQVQRRIGLVDRQHLRLCLHFAGRIGRRHLHRVRAINQPRQVAGHLAARSRERHVLHHAQGVLDHRRRASNSRGRIRRRVPLAVGRRLRTGQPGIG